MHTDKLIFAVIAGITVLITAFIFLTSLTGKTVSQPSDVVGLEPHIKGNPEAELTIVEFSDFECPFCAQYSPELSSIVKNYSGRVNVVYRHFPLVGTHVYAIPTARASEAAAMQGKFWEYHDKLFLNQGEFENDDLVSYAEQIGLDIDKFQTDLSSTEVAKKVQEDFDIAKQLNLSGTPTFFIVYNGETEKVILQNYDDLENRVAEILGDAPSEAISEENGQELVNDDAPENVMQNEPTTDNADAAMPAILDLINVQRDDIVPSQVEVVSVEKIDWPDASLGCPKDDQMYAQVITFGYKIMLSATGETYEYHTDESGEMVVLCE